jgi:hypothetical protein
MLGRVFVLVVLMMAMWGAFAVAMCRMAARRA